MIIYTSNGTETSYLDKTPDAIVEEGNGLICSWSYNY